MADGERGWACPHVEMKESTKIQKIQKCKNENVKKEKRHSELITTPHGTPTVLQRHLAAGSCT
jgi:hypothetical protein